METNREVIVKYRMVDMLDIIIPKGTSVHVIKGGGGKTYYAVSNVNFVYEQYPRLASILRHDFKYYYLFVPNDCVE